MIHEGKQPNPIEVILSTQRFVCRFQETHNKEHLDRRIVPKNGKVSTSSSSTWQLLIKTSSNRNRKKKRGNVFEARNRDRAGTLIFNGCHSTGAATKLLASPEAMVEAWPYLKLRN